MARALGYGVGNTNALRSFSGKVIVNVKARKLGYGIGNTLGTRSFTGKTEQFQPTFIAFLQRSNIRSLLGR